MSLPHVTSILREVGLVDTTWFTEEARDRGSALHLATEYLDRGELDEATVDPLIVSRLAAYRLFIKEMKPEILSIEEHVEYPGSYQGTLDRRVRIAGKEWVLDIKAGGPAPWHSLQLAGYALCFDRPLVRCSLYLTDTYKLMVWPQRRADDDMWRACVCFAAWRRKHGI